MSTALELITDLLDDHGADGVDRANFTDLAHFIDSHPEFALLDEDDRRHAVGHVLLAILDHPGDPAETLRQEAADTLSTKPGAVVNDPGGVAAAFRAITRDT